MSVYKELEEVGEAKGEIKELQNSLLEMYKGKKNREKIKELLITLNKIEEEMEELDREFSKYI